MGNWGRFEFNVPYNGESIESVNGIELSKQYLEFMREHNGGEGDIGEAWLVLFPLEELEEINYDYEIEKYLPGHIIIGSDGSGELYGIDENGRFFNVPVMIEAECVTYFGTNIEILPDEINAFWSE